MASLMDKFIRDDPIGAIEKIAKEQKMANQIQPKAPWDKDPTPQAVYYPPPGAMEGSSIGLNTAKLARPLSLSREQHSKRFCGNSRRPSFYDNGRQ